MTRILVLVLALLVPVPSSAHSWFPEECCSGRDCMEIAESALRPLPQGWGVIVTGEVFPYEAVRVSPDDRFYRCSPFFADTTQADVTLCLFVPKPMF